MGNIWHDINPKRIAPEDFIAVIEIPKGSKRKYELDKETGLMILDRILYTSTHYPANYGFIPRTYGDDGDPLDVVVICSEEIDSMTLVRCYPIGVIMMKDGGKLDEKIISIITNTRIFPSCPLIYLTKCVTSSPSINPSKAKKPSSTRFRGARAQSRL